jgi:hypothetical protein
MLNAIETIQVDRTLFKEDKLAGVLTYVNTISTITIAVVYVHVVSYYNAPFDFESLAKESIKVALLLPAIIATPVVVLFNFYPRSVFRKMYSRSIAIEVEKLKEKCRDNKLSLLERMSYVVDYDKLLNDELKHRLRLTLSDLPMGVTILVAIIEFLK